MYNEKISTPTNELKENIMKTTNLILILTAVLSLMSCGQLHVVTLYVDTTQINQSSIAQHASFGQPTGITNEDFTTHVRSGDKIIWEGVSISNPSDKVEITSINHISGDRIFVIKRRSSASTTPLLTTTPGVAGSLFKGAIRKKPRKPRTFLLEKYGIEFMVTGKEDTFVIDPVIKAHR